MLHHKLKNWIRETLGISGDFVLEYPANFEHGDFATNVALIESKKEKKNPRVLAEEYLKKLNEKIIPEVSSIEVAGPGFLNFKIKPEVFALVVEKNISQKFSTDENPKWKDKKVMVEYTDANPFKEFHVGHLMPNMIGESIARIFESVGAKVLRANWQGDVGSHVAMAVWGIINSNLDLTSATSADLGKCYALGSKMSKENEEIKNEIAQINKHIYLRDDSKINQIYDMGRKISLDYFEIIYKRLDTKFDYYFFESKEGQEGKAIVLDFLNRGVFEESDGAIIFPGEKYGLHTRVFMNSQGLTTYEAKELGLNKKKFEIEPSLSESIIVTGNEITDYFKVLLKAMSLVMPTVAEKTKHIAHGMLRLSSGKMSSRTGNVITAMSVIDSIKENAKTKIKNKILSEEKKDEIAEMVALAALRFTILRQAVGGNIVFNEEEALSFEGDSGPYLQYATVRAKSILKKAEASGLTFQTKTPDGWKTLNIERLLERFSSTISLASEDFAPHKIVQYLLSLAGEFNSFYGQEQIVDLDDKNSPYKIAVTKAFVEVMTEGLYILGIKVPEEM